MENKIGLFIADKSATVQECDATKATFFTNAGFIETIIKRHGVLNVKKLRLL